MWNQPSDEELSKLPGFYYTEHTPLKEKVVHMHFFLGGCDWHACEYSPQERNFFGFVILNDDLEMSEWGYFNFDELIAIKVGFIEVDRDLWFPPTKAIDVDRIRDAQRWTREEDSIQG